MVFYLFFADFFVDFFAAALFFAGFFADFFGDFFAGFLLFAGFLVDFLVLRFVASAWDAAVTDVIKITDTFPTEPLLPFTLIASPSPKPALAIKFVAAPSGSASPCRASLVPLSLETPELTLRIPVGMLDFSFG